VTKAPIRGRTGSGTVRQRSVAAAARAASKRAEKARGEAEPETSSRAVKASAGDAADVETPVKGSGAAEPETGSEPGPETTAKPFRQRSGLLTAVLAVLVVAGLVATGLLGWEYREETRTDQARTEALAAARKAAPVILSYDYRHLDRDFAAARRHLTGSFQNKYKKTTTSVVAPTAKKYQGVVTATVAKPPAGGEPAASVVSASPEKVVVLLFMNQVTKSTQVSGPRLDLNRVRMTLVDTSQGWKVSALDAL
jgi:Mce-associated membrane protein